MTPFGSAVSDLLGPGNRNDTFSSGNIDEEEEMEVPDHVPDSSDELDDDSPPPHKRRRRAPKRYGDWTC